MAYKTAGISELNKTKVSKKDVVSYLESLDVANNQVLKVLQKEPALPGYKKLPWVKESLVDKAITTKLKSNKILTLSETLRLKEILNLALNKLRKGHNLKVVPRMTKGLQNYIDKL